MLEDDSLASSKRLLDRLSGLFEHFERRRTRATERLAKESGGSWFFGIAGLEIEPVAFDFAENFIVLEEVEEPPGEIELARALVDPSLFGAIARYSRNIRHQIRIAKDDSTEQSVFNLAWWIVSLIRVRTLAEFLVPAASDHSWSVISGLPEKTCRMQFVEDVPTARRLAEPSRISEADLLWVRNNLIGFAQLLETPNFRLAVESLATHQHQASDRMMVATLWSGIEALFSIQSELSFRLAAYVASALEPPGATRRNLYVKLRKLYGLRSKAVHGARLSSLQIRDHTIEVRQLLSRLLCLIIESGKVPLESDFDKLLFGG